MANTAEQMEDLDLSGLLPSADNDTTSTPERDFTASDFASDTWEQARKRFRDAGIINVDPDDPELLTAYNRSIDYFKDLGLSGLLATQAAYEFAVGSVADSVPFMSENNKGRLARDLAAMPEAFVGGGTRSLSQIDDIAELAAPAAKQTIAKTVDLADRVYIDPNRVGTFGGSFALRNPGESGNFKKARELFKKEEGTDPRNFKEVNKKIWNETGWYIDPSDKQWRFEINDKKSKIDFKNFKGKELLNERQITGTELFDEIKNFTQGQSVDLSLTDFFKHDELYQKYPHLKRMRVTFYSDNAKDASSGSYSRGQNLIDLNMAKLSTDDEIKSVLLHEIQHSIQEYEGFTPGANYSTIPFELTDKHAKTLTSELVNNRETRKHLLEDLDGLSLSEGYNTSPIFKLLDRDQNLKPGFTLFASEESVVDKFADAVKKSGLPDNIFDLMPKEKGGIGGSPQLIKIGNILNELRNSHLDDVYHKEAIDEINLKLYKGTGGEGEANVASYRMNLSDSQRANTFPLDAKEAMYNYQKIPEDMRGSYDKMANAALGPNQVGFDRRRKSRRPDLGVADVKIDINFDGVYNPLDITNQSFEAMSATERSEAFTKFLLDNIIKDNKQLKKIKDLKRGDTFSITLKDGSVGKAKFKGVLLRRLDRQDVEKNEGQIILKDTDPNTNEDPSSFKIPEVKLEITKPTSDWSKEWVDDAESYTFDYTATLPEIIKNSDLVKDGKNFDIMDLQEQLTEEGNFSKIKNLFGFGKTDKKIQPTNLTDTVKNKSDKVDNVKPLTTAQKESLSADFQRIIDPSVNDNPDVFKLIFLDDEYAREILAEFRSPTRDITGDPAKLSEVQSLRNEIYNLTQEGLKDLPEEVTVYRYGPLNERDGVTSFTLDPLYGGSDPSLHLPWVSGKDYALESYTVKKSDILAVPDLIRDFGEAEVIIKNNAVQINPKKEPKNFAEGGDTVRPEPRPEAEVDISPRAEAGDQFFVKQAEREKAFKTKPKPRPSMDKSFPDVKPKARPKRVEKSGVYTEEYDLKGVSVEIPVIVFKDGEKIAFDKALQTIAERGTANEPVVGMDTEKQIRKFLDENNPTREEFETYWYNKRLNKGGMIGDQMQMAFMNEGGLTDDGMNTDPVSGNDIPSGSMAEEVRDDIPAQLSEGEYVVPADVVRYYGVKFFEDLRDRAKIGLAEMEANGRIGGEPVPEGGPINNEDLSPEEMQAIQEMMGMNVGGFIDSPAYNEDPYSQQQSQYTVPMQMDKGGLTQAQSNMLGGQSPAQVEQQILSAGNTAVNKPYIGQQLGFSIFGDSSPTTQQTLQQPQTSTFTPIVLYNKAGQSKAVNSEEEKVKAEADGYTMTLEQYNMYRSQFGGSGSGGSTITPPGGEAKESKPWGQDVNWNNVKDIEQFVAQAERGNLSGSGRFLRGAGFAIAGLPGALLAGAFQVGKGLNSIYDMEAAKIIAEAKGHTELAEKIDTGIKDYLKTAGDISNYFYKPKSKAVMSRVNRYLKGQGIDSIEDVQKAYSTTGTKIDTVKGKDGSTVNVYKPGKDTIKPKARPKPKVNIPSGVSGDDPYEKEKTSIAKQQEKSVNVGGPGFRNKGGLMTKGKKKK
jgi:hypothetical protein